LSVNVEMNLLSLVSPWLDKFCQITTKSATGTFSQKFSHLNTPSVVLVLVARLKYTSFMNTEPRMSLMLVKLKLKLEIKE
jgi:hypothetical protein